jgi:hypothetical protein
MLDYLDKLPLPVIIFGCLTLGLAPFVPEPHISEKLKMLANGTLQKPVDIFDLCFHGLPWAVLLAKLARMALVK